MTQQFGEPITNEDAYDTARSAAAQMSNNQLMSQDPKDLGSQQKQALKDEIAARKGK